MSSSSESGLVLEEPIPLTFGVEFEFLFGSYTPTVSDVNRKDLQYLRDGESNEDLKQVFDVQYDSFEAAAHAGAILRRIVPSLVVRPINWTGSYNQWSLTDEPCADLHVHQLPLLATWSNSHWTAANTDDWRSKGLELVSPVLQAPEVDSTPLKLNGLEEIQRCLRSIPTNVSQPFRFIANDSNAGLHVHIGCDTTQKDFGRGIPMHVLRHLAFILVMYEDIISLLHHPVRRGFAKTKSYSIAQSNRFGMRRTQHICGKPHKDFADTVGMKLFDPDLDRLELANVMDDDGSGRAARTKFVNFENINKQIRTVEFRQHHGTLDYKEVEQWVIFLTALVRAAERQAYQIATPPPSPTAPGSPKLRDELVWAMGQKKKYITPFESQEIRLNALFQLLKLSRTQEKYWTDRVKQWKEDKYISFATYDQCPVCEEDKVRQLDSPWDVRGWSFDADPLLEPLEQNRTEDDDADSEKKPKSKLKRKQDDKLEALSRQGFDGAYDRSPTPDDGNPAKKPKLGRTGARLTDAALRAKVIRIRDLTLNPK